MSKKIRHGFTLFELLIVISFIAIIFFFAIPNYVGFKNRQTIRSAAMAFAADFKAASAESLRSEQYVWVIFKTDSDNGAYYYTICRDLDDDGTTTEDQTLGNGLIKIGYPFKEYAGSVLWGGGIENDKKLTFGANGGVDRAQTDLTFNPIAGSSSGYYSVILSPSSGVETTKYTFEVRVYDDGKVEVQER
ncbi:MAG: prepilin-type N-terminal cleavage/methylation domain-containing protein [Candidatus Eremiobacteraeota bacterium]|nr:prepilin-type N-terminal cleavage/methylation domain-containing protein [Candidatus Eremiobacteraeota bacterium]